MEHFERAENLQEENTHLQDKIAKLQDDKERLEKEVDRLMRDRPTPTSSAQNSSAKAGMHPSASVDERIALIGENLQETLNKEIIEDVMKTEKRPLVIYWGTATTGRPHCGYFVPMVKIAHFLRAGCKVKILLADIHGFLDNIKAPELLVGFRAEYYKFVIVALLKSVNVPIDKLEFVLGSSYQRSEKYRRDLDIMTTVVGVNDAKRAGAEVVKQVPNPMMSSLIYPLMQALDEEHLGVDAQFGGMDQRKIFVLAQEQLPKIGYKQRAHLMNPMVPGLAGGKMSASDPDSKIDVLETPDIVKRKLKKAHAAPKEVEGNGVISFVEYVLLPVSALKDGKQGKFVVERKDGEPLIYQDIKTLKNDYEADTLTPQMLKPAVTTSLLELLEPIQKEFKQNRAWQDIEQKAYPSEQAKKKEKKVKNLGTRFPGTTTQIETMPDGHVEGRDQDDINLARGVGNIDIN